MVKVTSRLDRCPSIANHKYLVSSMSCSACLVQHLLVERLFTSTFCSKLTMFLLARFCNRWLRSGEIWVLVNYEKFSKTPIWYLRQANIYIPMKRKKCTWPRTILSERQSKRHVQHSSISDDENVGNPQHAASIPCYSTPSLSYIRLSPSVIQPWETAKSIPSLIPI